MVDGITSLGSTAELTGNTSTDNGSDGFSVDTGSTATLTGNTSSNNGANGVQQCQRSVATAVLTGNTIENNSFHGILSTTQAARFWRRRTRCAGIRAMA